MDARPPFLIAGVVAEERPVESLVAACARRAAQTPEAFGAPAPATLDARAHKLTEARGIAPIQRQAHLFAQPPARVGMLPALQRLERLVVGKARAREPGDIGVPALLVKEFLVEIGEERIMSVGFSPGQERLNDRLLLGLQVGNQERP